MVNDKIRSLTSELNCSSMVWECVQELVCNSTWNLSETEMEDYCLSSDAYLEKYLGPRYSPVFLPVCVAYLFIFSMGVVGNALTCAVIQRHRVMHTPTNFYLLSLAVSDLLVLVLGMPLELYELWRNYPFLLGVVGCYFKTFLLETVCFASVLNITALCVERYIAIVHPLRAKCVVTRAHAKRVIFTIWLTAMICSLPNTSLHGILMLPQPHGQGPDGQPDSATCMLVRPRWIYNLIIQISTLLFFVLPMATISALYLLIGLQLRREKLLQARGQSYKDSHVISHALGNARDKQQRSRRQQVTKMLFVLVVMFGICWAPFHTDRLMWSFMDEIPDVNMRMLQIYEYVHILSGVFFYLGSAVNPILYNLMSTRFREMFKEVMCGYKGGSAHRKCSLSVTRTTVRSVLSESTHGTTANVVEGEFELYEGQENETAFDRLE